jgi:hypothetical protein
VPYLNDFKMRRGNINNDVYTASNLSEVASDSAGKKETNHTDKWVQNNRFNKCFKGLGWLRGYVVQLYLKPNAKPHISPPRAQPYYLQPKIEEAIEQMLNEDVIEYHEGPAEWISNLAIVFKEKGAIRITVDLRGLNAELRDTHIPIPNPDTIRPGWPTAKYTQN